MVLYPEIIPGINHEYAFITSPAESRLHDDRLLEKVVFKTVNLNLKVHSIVLFLVLDLK